MVHFTFVSDMTFIDGAPTFVADVFPQTGCLLSSVAIAAEGSASISKESDIGQNRMTFFAAKTIRVPVAVHGFDDSADDEFTAFRAARSEKNVKVVLAVLPAFEFVKNAVAEWTETLSAHEAVLMQHFASGIDYWLVDRETIPAVNTSDVFQRHFVAKRAPIAAFIHHPNVP